MKRKPVRLRFEHMPYGTHYTDGERKFIKLQNVLPSGCRQKHYRVCHDPISEEPTACAPLYFNSVDYQGCSATCPDWLEFEVLKVKKTR